MSGVERAEGDLVPAAGNTVGGTVHASELTLVPARPDLGLTPWNPLCNTGWTHHERPGEAVTCRTCLRLLARRGLRLSEDDAPVVPVVAGGRAEVVRLARGDGRRAGVPRGAVVTAQPDYASNSDYGTCPVCGREFQLTKGGTLRHHAGAPGTDMNNYGTLRAYRCAGAGQPPAARH